MNRRLYYEDSYIKEFDATVVSCEKRENGYAVVLDATAFFPEGGGQPADTGTLGCAKVLDAHEKDGNVYHFTDKPLAPGETVHGVIDWERRFRLMQNHGGEHIVSGIVNRTFGLDNVGFHMGSEDITIDYNGYLDREQLLAVEYEANRIVTENRRVIAEFPSPEVLAATHYRSKKALTGEIRLVTIENCDVCACCAPHLSRTGEIGLVKILDSIKYKGGVRVHLHCGLDAIDDYNRKYEAVKFISSELSSKQDDVAAAFAKYEEDVAALKADAVALKQRILGLKVDALEATDGNICLFETGLGGEDLRKLCDAASVKCGGVCAVFSGEDGQYNFTVISRSVDPRAKLKEINEALSAKGGGSSVMIQGKAACSRAAAEEYFLKK